MDTNKFYYGGTYHPIVIGFSAASTWTWAPALILSTDIAANKGVFGILSFVIPNILALILFAVVGKRINPTTIWDNKAVSSIYHVGYGLVELFCVIIQVTAGAVVLSSILNISYNLSILLFLGCSFVIASIGGLHSSIISNVWQQCVLIFIAIALIFIAPLQHGIQPEMGTFSCYDTVVFSLILFSGPLMTNQHWQRSERTGYLYASVLFAIPLCCMGVIGLYAGMSGDYISLSFDSQWYRLFFLILIMSGLSSTLQSSLTSIICLFGGGESLLMARLKMGVLCALALTVILGDFQIMGLWKTMGSFRVIMALGVLYGLYVKRRKNSI